MKYDIAVVKSRLKALPSNVQQQIWTERVSATPPALRKSLRRLKGIGDASATELIHRVGWLMIEYE